MPEGLIISREQLSQLDARQWAELIRKLEEKWKQKPKL
jgi:hypothetical protein